MEDEFSVRMKKYEDISRNYLIRRIPVIIRVDGRAFHTLTRVRYGKGYSEEFIEHLIYTAKELQKEIQGCSLLYCQSDEISLLLTDYHTIRTEGWFDYNLQKVVSISASVASVAFTARSQRLATFDSRAFNLPQEEVTNYFIWRQRDATRNAIQMAGQSVLGHKHLQNKSCNEIQEMLFQKGINFNDYSVVRKRGFCVIVGEVDDSIPIFSQNRDYIERHVNVRED